LVAPTRGRGLKRNRNYKYNRWNRSPPPRGRGLKILFAGMARSCVLGLFPMGVFIADTRPMILFPIPRWVLIETLCQIRREPLIFRYSMCWAWIHPVKDVVENPDVMGVGVLIETSSSHFLVFFVGVCLSQDHFVFNCPTSLFILLVTR